MNTLSMNFDNYGEVINGKATYLAIAKHIYFNNLILIGWTDELGGHYDILFAYRTLVQGTDIQRGIKGSDLFISIIGKGAFGFKVEKDKMSSYVAEKLNLSDDKSTEKLTELINGVIKELRED